MLEDFNPDKILKKALKCGGDFADIYLENTQTTQILAEQGKIEKVIGGLDRGVGIHVIYDGKVAYGYTTELTQDSLETLADSVSRAVKAKVFEKKIVLKDVPPEHTFAIIKHPGKYEIPKKVALVQKADKTAWKTDKKIRQVKVVYGDMMKSVEMANSLGELTKDNRVYTVFFTQVVAGDGDRIQSGYHPVGGLVGLELLEENPPEEIAQTAAKQALLMLAADKAPAGTMPVVLSSEAGGTMVHEAVGHGLEADLACEGLSVYHNKIGKKIASEKITVLDNATIPNKRGSFSFDDEGVRSEKTLLIEKGILKNYMFDRRYALREGTASTGNGRRESFRHKPICRMTNTIIAPGKDDPEEIIRNTESGLFVRKMGGGQVNTVNGDFVFEVTEGYLIEKGKRGKPVRGATLVGNGPKVIQTIDLVGSDLGFSIGTCGKDHQGVPVGDAQPTIRIPELTVGGAA